MKKSKKKKHLKWIASDKFKGVRYYVDKSRKHGSRFDTFYGIRYQIDNKRYEYNLGYASQGWSEQKAALEIEKYKIASEQGMGAISKTEQRKINHRKRIEQAKLDEEEKRKRITFSEFFEYYINSQAHKSPNTVLAEKHLYKKWLKPVLGNIPFIAIKPYQLEQVKMNMLDKNRAAATIKYALSVVSQMWTLAKRDDLVFIDCPTQKVRLPKQDNARTRYLKEDEAKLLLNELRLHSEQLYEISLIALFTGMRFNEIVSLEVKALMEMRALLNNYEFTKKALWQDKQDYSSSHSLPEYFTASDRLYCLSIRYCIPFLCFKLAAIPGRIGSCIKRFSASSNFPNSSNSVALIANSAASLVLISRKLGCITSSLLFNLLRAILCRNISLLLINLYPFQLKLLFPYVLLNYSQYQE